MDSINVLLDYFSIFKKVFTNDKKYINGINKNIEILKENKKCINNFNEIEEIVNISKINEVIDDYINEKYSGKIPKYLKDTVNASKKGIDNILCNIFYNIIKYNNSLIYSKNKKESLEGEDLLLNTLDVQIKDILNYLEIDEKVLDKSLINDLINYKDISKIKEFASTIKTDNGMKRVLFDKIEDKNVLIAILIYSNLDIVNSVVKIFEDEKANINKVVNNIPSIFIKKLPNNAKYNNIVPNYDNFISNYNLIKENNIDFKKMLNQSVFLINDNKNNTEIINKLNDNIGVLTKNVIEYVGNICAINPSLVFKNISILKEYNIPLTNDDNNNGYTLLGMNYLREKIEYLITKKLWNVGENLNLDQIDLIRGLIIKDNYKTCNNLIKYGNINSTSYEEDNIYTEDSIKRIR